MTSFSTYDASSYVLNENISLEYSLNPLLL